MPTTLRAARFSFRSCWARFRRVIISPSVRSRLGRVGFQSRAFSIDLDTEVPAADESSEERLAATIFACLAPAPICDASEPRLLLGASVSAEPLAGAKLPRLASMNTLECLTDGKKSVFSRRKTRGSTDSNELLGSRRRTALADATACLWKLLRSSATLLRLELSGADGVVVARGDGVRVPDEEDDSSSL